MSEPRQIEPDIVGEVGPIKQIENLQSKGHQLVYVGDVVGTGSSRKSATNSFKERLKSRYRNFQDLINEETKIKTQQLQRPKSNPNLIKDRAIKENLGSYELTPIENSRNRSMYTEFMTNETQIELYEK